MIYRRLYNWPSFGWKSSFDEMELLKKNMDRLFNLPAAEYQAGQSVGVFPLINLTETTIGYHVRAELPGIKSNELEIQATAKSISIAGERKIEPENENVKYHRREREGGKFSRIITLPGEIDADKVEAKLVNGVLELIISKAELSRPKQIKIT